MSLRTDKTSPFLRADVFPSPACAAEPTATGVNRLNSILAVGQLHVKAVQKSNQADVQVEMKDCDVGTALGITDFEETTEVDEDYDEENDIDEEIASMTPYELQELDKDIAFYDEFHIDEHFDFENGTLEFDEEAFTDVVYHAPEDKYITLDELAEIDPHAALSAASPTGLPMLRKKGSGRTAGEKRAKKYAAAQSAQKRREWASGLQQKAKQNALGMSKAAYKNARGMSKAAYNKAKKGANAAALASQTRTRQARTWLDSKVRDLKTMWKRLKYKEVVLDDGTPAIEVTNTDNVPFARFTFYSDTVEVQELNIALPEKDGFMAVIHPIPINPDHPLPYSLYVPSAGPGEDGKNMLVFADGKLVSPKWERLGDWIYSKVMLRDIASVLKSVLKDFKPEYKMSSYIDTTSSGR